MSASYHPKKVNVKSRPKKERIDVFCLRVKPVEASFGLEFVQSPSEVQENLYRVKENGFLMQGAQIIKDSENIENKTDNNHEKKDTKLKEYDGLFQLSTDLRGSAIKFVIKGNEFSLKTFEEWCKSNYKEKNAESLKEYFLNKIQMSEAQVELLQRCYEQKLCIPFVGYIRPKNYLDNKVSYNPRSFKFSFNFDDANKVTFESKSQMIAQDCTDKKNNVDLGVIVTEGHLTLEGPKPTHIGCSNPFLENLVALKDIPGTFAEVHDKIKIYEEQEARKQKRYQQLYSTLEPFLARINPAYTDDKTTINSAAKPPVIFLTDILQPIYPGITLPDITAFTDNIVDSFADVLRITAKPDKINALVDYYGGESRKPFIIPNESKGFERIIDSAKHINEWYLQWIRPPLNVHLLVDLKQKIFQLEKLIEAEENKLTDQESKLKVLLKTFKKDFNNIYHDFYLCVENIIRSPEIYAAIKRNKQDYLLPRISPLAAAWNDKRFVLPVLEYDLERRDKPDFRGLLEDERHKELLLRYEHNLGVQQYYSRKENQPKILRKAENTQKKIRTYKKEYYEYELVNMHNPEESKDWLKDNTLHLTTRKIDGKTVLHYLAKNEHWDVREGVIEAGCNINIKLHLNVQQFNKQDNTLHLYFVNGELYYAIKGVNISQKMFANNNEKEEYLEKNLTLKNFINSKDLNDLTQKAKQAILRITSARKHTPEFIDLETFSRIETCIKENKINEISTEDKKCLLTITASRGHTLEKGDKLNDKKLKAAIENNPQVVKGIELREALNVFDGLKDSKNSDVKKAYEKNKNSFNNAFHKIFFTDFLLQLMELKDVLIRGTKELLQCKDDNLRYALNNYPIADLQTIYEVNPTESFKFIENSKLFKDLENSNEAEFVTAWEKDTSMLKLFQLNKKIAKSLIEKNPAIAIFFMKNAPARTQAGLIDVDFKVAYKKHKQNQEFIDVFVEKKLHKNEEIINKKTRETHQKWYQRKAELIAIEGANPKNAAYLLENNRASDLQVGVNVSQIFEQGSPKAVIKFFESFVNFRKSLTSAAKNGLKQETTNILKAAINLILNGTIEQTNIEDSKAITKLAFYLRNNSGVALAAAKYLEKQTNDSEALFQLACVDRSGQVVAKHILHSGVFSNSINKQFSEMNITQLLNAHADNPEFLTKFFEKRKYGTSYLKNISELDLLEINSLAMLKKFFPNPNNVMGVTGARISTIKNSKIFIHQLEVFDDKQTGLLTEETITEISLNVSLENFIKETKEEDLRKILMDRRVVNLIAKYQLLSHSMLNELLGKFSPLIQLNYPLSTKEAEKLQKLWIAAGEVPRDLSAGVFAKIAEEANTQIELKKALELQASSQSKAVKKEEPKKTDENQEKIPKEVIDDSPEKFRKQWENETERDKFFDSIGENQIVDAIFDNIKSQKDPRWFIGKITFDQMKTLFTNTTDPSKFKKLCASNTYELQLKFLDNEKGPLSLDTVKRLSYELPSIIKYKNENNKNEYFYCTLSKEGEPKLVKLNCVTKSDEKEWERKGKISITKDENKAVHKKIASIEGHSKWDFIRYFFERVEISKDFNLGMLDEFVKDIGKIKNEKFKDEKEIQQVIQVFLNFVKKTKNFRHCKVISALDEEGVTAYTSKDLIKKLIFAGKQYEGFLVNKNQTEIKRYRSLVESMWANDFVRNKIFETKDKEKLAEVILALDNVLIELTEPQLTLEEVKKVFNDTASLNTFTALCESKVMREHSKIYFNDLDIYEPNIFQNRRFKTDASVAYKKCIGGEVNDIKLNTENVKTDNAGYKDLEDIVSEQNFNTSTLQIKFGDDYLKVVLKLLETQMTFLKYGDKQKELKELKDLILKLQELDNQELKNALVKPLADLYDYADLEKFLNEENQNFNLEQLKKECGTDRYAFIVPKLLLEQSKSLAENPEKLKELKKQVSRLIQINDKKLNVALEKLLLRLIKQTSLLTDLFKNEDFVNELKKEFGEVKYAIFIAKLMHTQLLECEDNSEKTTKLLQQMFGLITLNDGMLNTALAEKEELAMFFLESEIGKNAQGEGITKFRKRYKELYVDEERVSETTQKKVSFSLMN